ncbi:MULTISPECIES: alpha/beta fold hydrolase [Sphingopyxis]|uniref:Proline iminopeptidase n=1 Tax=Sphingopyxis terrae subsp. ummariensis TaxID=429001 RepID=A0A1Y6ER94_9SPHN|nr:MULTISPECIES: alpha/beta fold hydrolase [Sphingopyxis]ENY80372.1 proline iminopeptidase [Sphingopyxis sp. MC1]PCF92347.1 proline iminopeptidase [Sphingopyxis terrae subsp. ummariensis]SMQ64789.1 prolyl aminopeptidase Serine peptidase. MEROPS family S33 [Sphingopyxis terrae subsp. ummariensis]
MDFSRLETSSKIGDGWRYPAAEPRRSGWLDVDAEAGHRIYWEEYGAAGGEPVMVLHGGPGGACSPEMARFFDPARYRIILFDQRGCGKSEPNVAAAGPAAALRHNDTPHLIDDINRLRDALDIAGPMHVFGGSWGSTLAMAYAIAFPQHCASLILRGIFLGSAEDLDYLYQGNAATWHEAPYALTAPGAYINYPDEWAELLGVLSVAERRDVMASYKAIFDMVPQTDAERERQLHAALVWSLWEGTISNLIPEHGATGKFGDADFALCFAQIEAHFFANDLFLEPGHLIGGASTLASIPVHIVHGRFDEVCPLTQASRLVAALRDAGREPATYVVTNAGHSAMERENALALTAIMDGLPPLR